MTLCHYSLWTHYSLAILSKLHSSVSSFENPQNLILSIFFDHAEAALTIASCSTSHCKNYQSLFNLLKIELLIVSCSISTC